MKSEQAQAQLKHVGRRQRRPYPPTAYADPALSFEQAMADAYRAYGEEQKRLIDLYYTEPTEPPVEPPATGDIPLPPGYDEGGRFFDDEFMDAELDLSKWTPTVGDPRWGIWPGGLPVDWNNPDGSPSGMGPWSNNWEYFSPSQVRTGNGCELVAQRDRLYADLGYEWKSGIIRSKILLEDGLGRVICKFGNGSGLWDGIWFLNDQGTAFEPDWIETGFTPFAAGADQDSSAASTLHEEDHSQNQVRYNAGSMSENYRTWDCEYVSGSHLTWWLDGVQRHHVKTNVRCKLCLMVNHSIASPIAADWHSQVDTDTPDPVSLHIKRVQMFKRP